MTIPSQKKVPIVIPAIVNLYGDSSLEDVYRMAILFEEERAIETSNNRPQDANEVWA